MIGELQFGHWLKEHRRALDLTQEELALSVDCSWETIRKIESGGRRPSKQVAELLADFFGIPPEERRAFISFARSGKDAAGGLPRPSAYRQFASQQPPNNLPAQRTAFIGRYSAIAAASTLLRRWDVRLLTLTGAPGIGKTRLAIEIARSSLKGDEQQIVGDETHYSSLSTHYFRDGVFFVPLAPVTDPSLVATAIVQALAMKESSGLRHAEYLRAYLRGKKMLLVLDNFEHVVEEGHMLADLLVECPHLKLLVTSRAMLRIYGEHEFRVPPMLLPDKGQMPTLPVLSQIETVDLFIQRARATKSDFTLTDENAGAIVEICHRLDGLPLAIELAAARINILSPQAILSRLGSTGSRLALLTGGALDLPNRHRTLRDAIAWSYDLLDHEEAALFRQLGVFVGGCTLEAAETVAGGWMTTPEVAKVRRQIVDGVEISATKPPAPDTRLPSGQLAKPTPVLDLIASLVDNSLLKQEEGIEGESRLTMLEAIREYALERLAESGQLDGYQHRYAAYFARLAESAEPHFMAPRRERWLRRIDTELDNLRAVLLWSQAETGDPEIGLRMAGALHWFWYFRGHITEGRDWLERALAMSNLLQRSVTRAKALTAIGRLAILQDDSEAIIARLKESLDIWREAEDKGGLAYAATLLGTAIAYSTRDIASGGLALIEEGIRNFREAGDKWGHAFALDLMADATLLTSGNEQQNARYREESLVLYRQLDDDWGIAGELTELGNSALRLGDFESARANLNEALEMHRVTGDKWYIAHSLLSLALVAWHQSDYTYASACGNESLLLYAELQDRLRVSTVLRNLGHIAWEEGAYGKANLLYQKSVKLAHDIGSLQNVALSIMALAGIAITQAQHSRAARLFGSAEAMRQSSRGLLPSVDRSLYACNLEILRVELDESTLANFLERGAAMTVDECISLALEGEQE